MVCNKCEQKLSKVGCPDVWKDGARNTTGGKDGGRKVGGNMLLTHKTASKKYFDPYGSKCKACTKKIETDHAYCNKCSYEKGFCKKCGNKIMNTKMYKMSNV